VNNDKAIHQGPTTTNYGDSTYHFVPSYNEGFETYQMRNERTPCQGRKTQEPKSVQVNNDKAIH